MQQMLKFHNVKCNMASWLCPSALHPSISPHFLFSHICLTPIYINCHLVLLLLMVRVISFLLSLWSLLTIPLISPLLLHHCPSTPTHTLPFSLSLPPPRRLSFLPNTPADDRTPRTVNNSLISALHGA